MKIKLDRERTIRFNTAAIIQIEEKLDCSIFEIMSDQRKLMRIGTIVVVVWAGLEDDLDFEYVKENFPLKRLVEITEKIFGEINRAIGGDEEAFDEELAKVKKKEGSSKTSENGSVKSKETTTAS